MNEELFPKRVRQAAQNRIDDGWYQTLVFGFAVEDESEVISFGKLDDNRAPDGETVYEIGSITKAFTATLLAEALLSNRLMLSTPIGDLVPDLDIPERNGKKITLEQIATHHSGLPFMPSNMDKESANPHAAYNAKKLKEFLASYELPRDPGELFEYSNLAYGLLGYALAESAQTTYGALLDQRIFRPLGMTLSGTELTDKMRSHLATGHDEMGNPAPNMNLDAMAGAGGICSTANDLVLFLKANMDIEANRLTSEMKLVQNPLAKINEKTRIGLAWVITDRGIIFHNGRTDGYTSFLGFTSDRRKGVVVLSNNSVLVDDLGLAVLDEGACLAPVYKEISLPDRCLKEYVGDYELLDKSVLEVRLVGNQCSIQKFGESALRILPSARDEFFVRRTCICVSFRRDGAGTVNSLVLHQNSDQFARKLNCVLTAPIFTSARACGHQALARTPSQGTTHR